VNFANDFSALAEAAVDRSFGSVTGFFKPAPSPKPCQKPKILAAYRCIFSFDALSRNHAVKEGDRTRPACRPSRLGEDFNP